MTDPETTSTPTSTPVDAPPAPDTTPAPAATPGPAAARPLTPEPARRRGLLVALVALLVALGVVVPPVAEAADDRTPDEVAAEARLFEQHNVARGDPGRFGYGHLDAAPDLAWAHDLAQVARDWSREMARSGFRHNPDVASEACCWTRLGENISWRRPVEYWGGPEPTADDMMQGWMDSQTGHRETIMDGSFTQVGIGVHIDDDDGMWATAVFRTPTDDAPDGDFIDVPADHDFRDEITWMAETGLSDGYPDGTFRPGGPVTRQAMASFLHRLAGEPAAGTPEFSDVSASHTFAEAIAWMDESGLSEGYPDGTFRPGVPVTRQAMAAFLHRYETGG